MSKEKENRVWFKYFTKNFTQVFFIILLLLPFEFFLYKIFSQLALAFGCFDDCFNYMGGYFILHGKTIYSDFFFNHAMGMAYFSYLVQLFHHPINIYDLVLSHRQAIMIVGFIFDVLIIKRFKWAGTLFVILYELTKFYVFGDRFLGEAVVVYAAVFLMGLTWEKLQGKKLSLFDYVISGIFTWLIIFTREPYIPLALFLYGVILWKRVTRAKIISLIIFLALTILALLNTYLSDFYFNVVAVNLATIIKGEAGSNNLLGTGFFQVILYPLFILFLGRWNNFHYFLISLDAVFFWGVIFELIIKKEKLLVLLIILILGVGNIRFTPPGTIFYEAYHMLVWFGMFLMIVIFFAFDIFNTYKKIGIFAFGLILFGWSVAVFSPPSYLYDKIDLQEQLLTNFGTVMNVGNVVRNLSHPQNTLFLDGADEMIYFVSERSSSYKYTWYTSVMPAIPQYTAARISMFKNTPPDFYYDFCSPQAPYHSNLPDFVRPLYQQLYSNGKPSCLYVKKSKLNSISSKQ